MKKILELTDKHFMSGIAPSSQLQNKGLWHKALGVTVMRDIFLESDNVGLLQAAPLPTNITNSVIQDVPIAWTVDPQDATTGFGKLYIWDKAGNLYVIGLVGDNMPTKLTSGGQGAAANGLFLIKHSTGTQKLYYFREADLGYYGNLAATPSFHTADYSTDIQSTPYHPTHRLFDRTYFGNGRYIGTVADNGSGGIDVVAKALDIEIDQRVNCLSDDGTYLVAGITTNKSTDSLSRGLTRIIFWDTNQSSWQREWPIPDASIIAIKRVGGHMEAVTTRGVFAFTFDSPPQQVLPYLLSADTPSYSYPGQFAVDVLGEALLFGGNNRVSTFGKMIPQMPTAYFQPFSGFGTDDVTLVASSAKTNDIIVGTSGSKLYRVKANGAPQTGVSAETIYMDLQRWWQIGRIVVEFDGQLATGDDLSIQVRPDDGTSAKTWGSATFTANGAIRTKEIYNTQEAEKLKVILNFNGGSPRIRNLEIWGDPIERPTHTRV
jgi:hypothetical protein